MKNLPPVNRFNPLETNPKSLYINMNSAENGYFVEHRDYVSLHLKYKMLEEDFAESLNLLKICEKWAQLGLMDFLPDWAKEGFLNDWEQVENFNQRFNNLDSPEKSEKSD